jgi:hypothetical protein
MSKDKVKGFVAGIIITAVVLSVPLSGFALSGAKGITANYSNIKIYVNQALISPKDGNGNSVEPFIYNGTVYLPVRAISEALNQKVSWNTTTKSVYIGTQPIVTSPTVSTEYNNALKKAVSYSEIMHMSKSGIYNQLTSDYGDKFTADAAQYAIDNIKADWNANALAKAKEYQDAMSMSKDAIYDQLSSDYGEKFTKEEAQYAIDHLAD